MTFEIMFTVVNILTIVALYWAFRDPKELFESRKKRGIVTALAFLYGGFALLSLTGKESALYLFFAAYPLLYAVTFRSWLKKILTPFSQNTILFFLVTFFILWIGESVVPVDYIINRVTTQGPTVAYVGVFSIFQHLFYYLGFYFGLALTIIILYRRWNFSTWQTLTAGGLWGILIEQYFLGPRLLLSGDILGFITFIPFIFITYGLYLTGPLLLFYEGFANEKPQNAWQTLFLFLTAVLLPLAAWVIWAVILEALGISFEGIV